jgi:hypothetical protein
MPSPGFEPGIFWAETKRLIQLDYEGNLTFLIISDKIKENKFSKLNND